MVRFLLALVLSLFALDAYAACTPPLAVKDGSGNTVNMSVVQGADGSCQYYVDIDASSRMYQALTAAIPAGTSYIGQSSPDPSTGGATPAFSFLALPATTTTEIVALSGSTKTYVTSVYGMAGGTVNVTFKYGTGTNCGTGTTTLSGPWPWTAQVGFTQGAGTGAVMIVPAGKALCVTTDASVGGGVHLTYQQK